MNVVIAILLSLGASISYAAFPAIPGISPLNSDKFKETLEAKNIPRAMSQDTLGICFAYPASTLLTSENCRALKTDCAKISDKDIFSPLDLANYAKIDNSGEESEPIAGFDTGGHSANVMRLINYITDSSASEECASLDKVLDKVGGAQAGTEAQLAIWEGLKKKYNKLKSLKKECATCVTDFFTTAKDEINQNFNLKKSNEELLRAFAEDSYNEFLSNLLIPKECHRPSKRVYLEASNTLEVKSLPDEKSNKKSNYKEAIGTIKKVLADGRGIALSNLCLQSKVPKKFSDCETAHALTITGYRKICSSDGVCRDALKIQNSWGKSWEDSLGTNGWVDAKTLLDKSTYNDAFLAWFEDKPKKED